MNKLYCCLTVLLILLILSSTPAVASNDDTDFVPIVYGVNDRNALFLEIFGSGGLVTVQYERIFSETIVLRGGVGYFSNIHSRGMSFPLEVMFLSGKGRGKFEIGGGATYYDVAGDGDEDSFFDLENSGFRGTLFFGYRYISLEGYIYRIGFTPVFSSDDVYPYSGFSVGATF